MNNVSLICYNNGSTEIVTNIDWNKINCTDYGFIKYNNKMYSFIVIPNTVNSVSEDHEIELKNLFEFETDDSVDCFKNRFIYEDIKEDLIQDCIDWIIETTRYIHQINKSIPLNEIRFSVIDKEYHSFLYCHIYTDFYKRLNIDGINQQDLLYAMDHMYDSEVANNDRYFDDSKDNIFYL